MAQEILERKKEKQNNELRVQKRKKSLEKDLHFSSFSLHSFDLLAKKPNHAFISGIIKTI